jgi:hypothetical protein
MADYKIITDLRQRHIEKWVELLDPLSPGENRYIVTYAGDNLRAAIRAGILEGMTVEDVDDLTTPETFMISKEIADLCEPLLIPPQKN